MENITSKGTIFGTLIAQAGPKGDTGKTGDRGLTGEAGYSPIKGVDYFTQEDISEIRKGIEGDLTGEYNKNAIEKTNIFNTNAKETTTSFDLNAENKTKEYNDNALAEIEKYNSNAIEKSNNFDTNFENKTSKFDSNCDEKTKEFNDNNDLGIQNYNNNAKKQMEIFDTNFTEKLEAFNNNAGNKFNGFNTNSDKALAEYNKNHTAKMKEFDDNYDTKTKTFDDNAAAKLDEYNENDKTKTDAYNNNASNKEETFNTNAADKQNEFDENASDKLAEYNQNAKELINKVEQVQAENETLKAENKLIKEQIPSANASGNSIHIEDSGSLDFDWKINGGHKQETRDGRQLFNKNDYVGIYQGYYDNGVLNKKDIRHNWIIMKYEKVNAELSYYYKNTTNGYNIVFTNLLPDEGVPVLADGSPYYYKTTSPDNSKYVMFYIGSEVENDWNFEERLNSLMVEETSERLTANDYEQYGVSPSSGYPSEVETVGSNVNLFDKNSNGIQINHYLYETGHIIGEPDANWLITDYMKVKSNSNYVISGLSSSGGNPSLVFYNKNKEFISGLKHNDWKNGKVITTPDNCTYIRDSIKINDKDTYKITEGSIVTPYSPYGMGSVEKDVVNKNFLVLDNVDEQTVNEMKYSCQNGEIEVQGTATATLDLFFPCKIVGYNNICTLNASADGELDKNACAIRMLKEGKNVTNANSFGNVYRTLKKPQIVPITADMKREKYQYICIHINEGTTANFKLKVWLNWGTDVTDYTRSQSQTAIMPVQQAMLDGDYIEGVEHHEWDRLMLMGDNVSGRWTVDGGNEYRFVIAVDNMLPASSITEKTNIICNTLKTVSALDTYNKIEGIAGDKNSNILIYIEECKDMTVEEFKAYLNQKYNSGTPVTIYYKLATPVNLELTEEQKAVRDTKLYTYKNITNIDVSDELASIDITYKKDLDLEHEKLQNQIDEIRQLISTTETSALLLDNLQKDVESEVE